MRAANGHASLQDAVFDRLLRERIVFLGTQVDDDVANQICAQMLLLSADDARSDIH
jgi:ATP-dependent Clp protease protease subunit